MSRPPSIKFRQKLLRRIARRLRKTARDMARIPDLLPEHLVGIKAGLWAMIKHEAELREAARCMRKPQTGDK